MFDSEKYRNMIEGDLAELLKHHKRVEAQRKEVETKAKELEKEATVIQHRINSLKEMAATLDVPRNGFVRPPDDLATTAAMYRFKKSLIKPDRGLIKNVRTLVHGVGRHRLSPPDVRDILVECGFPDTKNLLSEIHAALRRLKERGEVAPVKFANSTKIVGYRSRGLLGMRLSNGTKQSAESRKGKAGNKKMKG